MLEPNVTIADAAGPAATLRAMLISLGVGAVLLVPSLVWLFVLFQRGRPARATPGSDLGAQSR
jgi:cytochrome bd ubiquinol oxidase subunit II